MFFRYALGIACLLLVCQSPGLAADSKPPLTQAEWLAQQMEASRESEKIMHAADQRRGMLARYQAMLDAYTTHQNPAFRLIFNQYLSWYQSFVGDYPAAQESFSIKDVPQADDHPSPIDGGGYTARPALTAIAELAKSYQLVMLNEAHNLPLTRTLTVQLLSKLRAEGYTYFGMETLYQTDTELSKRGYPIDTSGFYTAEPISAEIVRTALKLGFHVFGYEALSDATGDAREAEQAANIYHEVFQKDPHARLVLEAGYAHIQKSGLYLGGMSMAEHLHKLTGIDGLAVEQTMLLPHSYASDNHPIYNAVMQQQQPHEPIVFINGAGKPWALRDGYDVSVLFPPQRLRRGRPAWLSLGGLRQPYFVSGEGCGNQFPCLVEARYANECKDAIPADRMVLDPQSGTGVMADRVRLNQIAPSGDLYLRPGQYRLSFSDLYARVLYAQDINVALPPATGDAPTAITSATDQTDPNNAAPISESSVPTGAIRATELEPVEVTASRMQLLSRLPNC